MADIKPKGELNQLSREQGGHPNGSKEQNSKVSGRRSSEEPGGRYPEKRGKSQEHGVQKS